MHVHASRPLRLHPHCPVPPRAPVDHLGLRRPDDPFVELANATMVTHHTPTHPTRPYCPPPPPPPPVRAHTTSTTLLPLYRTPGPRRVDTAASSQSRPHACTPRAMRCRYVRWLLHASSAACCLRSASVLTGHNHYVMSAAFHPKEDLVVSARSAPPPLGPQPLCLPSPSRCLT